jgi:hypothetical protein
MDTIHGVPTGAWVMVDPYGCADVVSMAMENGRIVTIENVRVRWGGPVMNEADSVYPLQSWPMPILGIARDR